METNDEAAKEIEKLKTSISELEREREEWRTESYGKSTRVSVLTQEVEWFKVLVMKLATIRQ